MASAQRSPHGAQASCRGTRAPFGPCFTSDTRPIRGVRDAACARARIAPCAARCCPGPPTFSALTIPFERGDLCWICLVARIGGSRRRHVAGRSKVPDVASVWNQNDPPSIGTARMWSGALSGERAPKTFHFRSTTPAAAISERRGT
jgi:hypothetical protein